MSQGEGSCGKRLRMPLSNKGGLGWIQLTPYSRANEVLKFSLIEFRLGLVLPELRSTCWQCIESVFGFLDMCRGSHLHSPLAHNAEVSRNANGEQN